MADGIRVEDDARHQQLELKGIPAVEREIDDPALVHHFRDCRLDQIHAGRRAFNNHLLADRADLHFHLDREVLVHLQDDVSLDEGLESLHLDLHRVRADRQQREVVVACRVGDHAARGAGPLVSDRHDGAGNYGPGFVRNRPDDRSAGGREQCVNSEAGREQHTQDSRLLQHSPISSQTL